jgi:hypothetical protein
MIIVTGQIDPSGSGAIGYMSFSGGGITASDTQALIREHGTSSDTGRIQASVTYVVSGITPGTQTISISERSGTATANVFTNRQITVIPL